MCAFGETIRLMQYDGASTQEARSAVRAERDVQLGEENEEFGNGRGHRNASTGAGGNCG